MMTLISPIADVLAPGIVEHGSFGGATEMGMLALAVIAVTSMMVSLRRRRRRMLTGVESPVVAAGSSSDHPEPASPDTDRAREARRDLEAAMLELDELARQIHGRIDTRIARLEAAIRDADGRIEKLSRLVEQSRQGQRLSVTLAEELPAGGASAPSVPPTTDNVRAEVERQTRAGRSPVEIARSLNVTPGEVELIVGLQKATTRR